MRLVLDVVAAAGDGDAQDGVAGDRVGVRARAGLGVAVDLGAAGGVAEVGQRAQQVDRLYAGPGDVEGDAVGAGVRVRPTRSRRAACRRWPAVRQMPSAMLASGVVRGRVDGERHVRGQERCERRRGPEGRGADRVEERRQGDPLAPGSAGCRHRRPPGRRRRRRSRRRSRRRRCGRVRTDPRRSGASSSGRRRPGRRRSRRRRRRRGRPSARCARRRSRRPWTGAAVAVGARRTCEALPTRTRTTVDGRVATTRPRLSTTTVRTKRSSSTPARSGTTVTEAEA